MSSKRQSIREALKTMLLDQTLAGSNVYSNRVSILQEEELPAIGIATQSEEAVPGDVSGKQYIRDLSINIVIKAEGNENVDDQLDQIAEEVEDILSANQGIDGQVLSSVLESTAMELSEEGTTTIGSLTLTFNFKYIR